MTCRPHAAERSPQRAPLESCLLPDARTWHRHLALAHHFFESARRDRRFYLELVGELKASTVLDVHCGAGALAVQLASAGRLVTGVEPDDACLRAARSRNGGDKVTWIEGSVKALPLLDADLVVMLGNVAQEFVAGSDWMHVLEEVGRALRPGGHVVFNTRRPVLRAWMEWAYQAKPAMLDVPGAGAVQRQVEVRALALPFVSLRYTYRFLADDTLVTYDSTLRFRNRGEVESDLTSSGYRLVDVADAPDRPGQEFVVVAERVT